MPTNLPPPVDANGGGGRAGRGRKPQQTVGPRYFCVVAAGKGQDEVMSACLRSMAGMTPLAGRGKMPGLRGRQLKLA